MHQSNIYMASGMMRELLFIGTRGFLTLVTIALLCGSSEAQDAFFNNFETGKSYFNPSLVGTTGSLSITAKHKRQWHILDPWFQTTYFAVEESLPCTFLDWGLSFLHDSEGTAGFTTREGAFNIAGTIPFTIGNHLQNVKIGFSPRYSQKSIDYDRLVFSDQLDPKYGPVNASGVSNPTSFIPPDNTGLSNSFFSPSLGITFVTVWNAKKRNVRKIITSLGASITHVLALSDDLGNIESVQRLTAEIPARYSFFAEAEIRPIIATDYFISLTPIVVYQHQARLNYWEMGASIGYNRDARFGLFLQYSPSNLDQISTNTLIGQLDLAIVRAEDHRVDLGINFSTGLTGFKNSRSNMMEVSLTYHFKKSVTCSLAGMESDPTTDTIECPGDKYAGMKRYQDLFYYSLTKWKK